MLFFVLNPLILNTHELYFLSIIQRMKMYTNMISKMMSGLDQITQVGILGDGAIPACLSAMKLLLSVDMA